MPAQRSFPEAIQQLYVWLLEHGFQVMSDERGGMGGALLTLSGRTGAGSVAWIEISGDRGHWAIKLRFDGMSRYIAAQVWAAYVDNVGVSGPSIEQQAAFIRDRLNDVAIAYVANPGVEGHLVRIGEEYMRNKYPNLFENR